MKAFRVLHVDIRDCPRGDKTFPTWTRNETSEESNETSEEMVGAYVENKKYPREDVLFFTWISGDFANRRMTICGAERLLQLEVADDRLVVGDLCGAVYVGSARLYLITVEHMIDAYTDERLKVVAVVDTSSCRRNRIV